MQDLQFRGNFEDFIDSSDHSFTDSREFLPVTVDQYQQLIELHQTQATSQDMNLDFTLAWHTSRQKVSHPFLVHLDQLTANPLDSLSPFLILMLLPI